MGATDKQRNLFLKGFKLSKQGGYEDPTYLGFKVVFDFGVLPIDPEDGVPPSPLLKPDNYNFLDNAVNSFTAMNPFGQDQYSFKSPGPAFYSAAGYLNEREDGFANGGKRGDMLIQFQNTLRDLVNNYPWFLQSISGLDALAKVTRSGFPNDGSTSFNPQRTAGKVLDFRTLESLNLRVTALATLYNQATFDYDNMRELVPRNLRRFTMYIFVSEIRNFFKTSRLIGSSASIRTIDNLASLLGNGNNPGTNLGVITQAGADRQNQQFSSGGASNPSNGFNSFIGNILNTAGVDNDLAFLKNQQDQAGIKPVIVFECKNCEFDFSESTPVGSQITPGTGTPDMTTQGFKIYVGKVRMKSQFPNIRSDGNPLILGDSWDGSKSSVQKSPTSRNQILSLGEELLTNFIGNSLNDLINEGASSITRALSGLDRTILGNAYTFNTALLNGSNLSFNNAQNFLQSLGTNNRIQTPQTLGQGGVPQRVYTPPSGDAYSAVPGSDLGVPGRVYPQTSGDSYSTSPGSSLGLPGRTYNSPGGDAYSNVPGPDLGVPTRVYPNPGGDSYPTSPGQSLGLPTRSYSSPNGDEYVNVPGSDLGVPGRVYQNPRGDVYSNSPGSDLGLPGRNYIAPRGDEFQNVPGTDLGVPDRVYPNPSGDSYPNSPGSDLGLPGRRYSSPSGDLYPEVPGKDLGVPSRVYSDPSGDVYGSSPGSDLGLPSRTYMASQGDEYPTSPGSDLGVPSRVYPVPSGDEYTTSPGPDLGLSSRTYSPASGDEYTDVPGTDLGVPTRVYPSVSGDVYSTSPGSDLGLPNRAYSPSSGDEYSQVNGTDLGVPNRVYPNVSGDLYTRSPGSDLGLPDRAYSMPDGDKYVDVPGRDLGVPGRVYPNVSGDVYSGDIYSNPPNKLAGERAYQEKDLVNFDPSNPVDTFNGERPSPVYPIPSQPTEQTRNLGSEYQTTLDDFLLNLPVNLGNLQSPDRYNTSSNQLR